MPTSERRARVLLEKGKAAIFRMFPFTIILKDKESGDVQPTRLKIDPGSKKTGVVLVNEATRKVVFAMVLVASWRQPPRHILSRTGIRRRRRFRNTRYRKPRFLNRTRPEGWLPPSLLHRRRHNHDLGWKVSEIHSNCGNFPRAGALRHAEN